MASKPSRFASVFFTLLGVVFGSVGLFFLLSNGAKARIAKVSAMPVITATTLANQPSGTAVLFEGRIAPETRAGFREFVAWEKDQFAGHETEEGKSRREKWRHVETVTPSLSLQTTDGPLAISNARYELAAPRHDWSEPVPSQVGLFDTMPFRARGFFAGDAVVVEGRVMTERLESGASVRRGFEAAVMFGGDRATYVQSLRDAAFVQRLLGMTFTPLGGLLLALAVWLFCRGGNGTGTNTDAGGARRSSRR